MLATGVELEGVGPEYRVGEVLHRAVFVKGQAVLMPTAELLVKRNSYSFDADGTQLYEGDKVTIASTEGTVVVKDDGAYLDVAGVLTKMPEIMETATKKEPLPVVAKKK